MIWEREGEKLWEPWTCPPTYLSTIFSTLTASNSVLRVISKRVELFRQLIVYGYLIGCELCCIVIVLELCYGVIVTHPVILRSNCLYCPYAYL